MAAPDPNQVRLGVAHRLLHQVQQELGPDLLALAVYGSVAHGQARAHSDLEVVVLTADGVPAREEQRLEATGGEGESPGSLILVEVDRLSRSRMLAAAERVGPLWGVEADQ